MIYWRKNALSAYPFASETLDSSTDLAANMKGSHSGDGKNVGLYEMAVQILTAKKSLRRTNQMSGSKKFCTA